MDLGDLPRVRVASPVASSSGRALVSGESVQDYDRIISSRIARMDINPLRKGRFFCRAASTRLGDLQITRIQSDPVEISRTKSCIERDNQTQYLVGLNLAGSAEINHCHGSNAIGVGSLFLLDKAAPYQAKVIDQAERILMVIPRRLLESRMPDPSRHLNHTPSAASGIGRLAGEHLQFLAQEGHLLSPENQVRAIQMCLELIALTFLSCEEHDGGFEREMAAGGQIAFSRAKAHLKRLVDDPDLSPAKAAARFGVSKRYLHKLFSNNGTTFGSWVREERLLRAHALLTDPQQVNLSVTEVAMRQGFNDIPHFCRLFKARFALTPTQARAAATSDRRA